MGPDVMYNSQSATGHVLGWIRDKRQAWGPYSFLGKMMGCLDLIVASIFQTWRNVVGAPVNSIVMFLLLLTVGVLGLVPGVLNLIGQNHKADIVTVVAGCVATILAIVQFLVTAVGVRPVNELVGPQA